MGSWASISRNGSSIYSVSWNWLSCSLFESASRADSAGANRRVGWELRKFLDIFRLSEKNPWRQCADLSGDRISLRLWGIPLSWSFGRAGFLWKMGGVQSAGDLKKRAAERLDAVGPLNKTDIQEILTCYGGLSKIFQSSAASLESISGLGPKRLKLSDQPLKQTFPGVPSGRPPCFWPTFQSPTQMSRISSRLWRMRHFKSVPPALGSNSNPPLFTKLFFPWNTIVQTRSSDPWRILWGSLSTTSSR